MFNPKRLILARRRRGTTKKRLAEEVGVSMRSLSYYEAGEREPEAAVQERISAALRFPVAFFSLADLDELPTESASFRSLSRMTITQRESVLAAGSLALAFIDYIEESFELPACDIPDLRERKDPEGAAAELRAAWNLGDRPVRNVVHLLESKGARVFSLAEGFHEVDAFSVWRATTPFVFLNTIKSAERSRFDAAHELGHLVLHRHDEPRGKDSEREANAFASAFLMPRADFLARNNGVPSIRRIIDQKRYWGVAAVAYAFRLHDLGVISDWVYYDMMKKMSSMGYRREEPNPGPREQSQLLWKVFDQLRTDGISRLDVARRLAIGVEDLDQLVFGLVLTSREGDGGGTSSKGDRDHLYLVKG